MKNAETWPMDEICPWCRKRVGDVYRISVLPPSDCAYRTCLETLCGPCALAHRAACPRHPGAQLNDRQMGCATSYGQ